MNRRLGWSLLLCLLTGCSTHPVANMLDFFCPGKMYPNQKDLVPYGGVGIPQGPILTPASAVTIGVPFPPGVVPVPGPTPLPGNVPPPGFQLQPPLPPTPPPTFGR